MINQFPPEYEPHLAFSASPNSPIRVGTRLDVGGVMYEVVEINRSEGHLGGRAIPVTADA